MENPRTAGAAHPPIVLIAEAGSGLADLFRKAGPQDGAPDSFAACIELVQAEKASIPEPARGGIVVLAAGARAGAGDLDGPAPFVASAVIGPGNDRGIIPDAPPAAECAAMGVLSVALMCLDPDADAAGPRATSTTILECSVESARFLKECVAAGRAAAMAPHRVMIAGIAGRDHGTGPDDPRVLKAARRLLRFIVSWADSLGQEALPAATIDSTLPGIWLTASMEREARRLLGALVERTGQAAPHWTTLPPMRRVLGSPASPKQKGKELLGTLRDLCLSAPSLPVRPRGARSALEGLRRVFVEEQALGYPAAQAILARLEDCERIVIGSYKSVLNRKQQSPALQKRLMRAAVLGVKKGRFLYRQVRCSAPEGYAAFYASPVIGCLHHCRYCFVECKWGCGHLVIFVNHEDLILSIIEKLRGPGGPPPWIAFGYDSELLDFSSFYPATAALLDGLSAVDGKPGFRGATEIITKSASTHAFDGRAPLGNLVVSFSLSPPEVWERFEEGTAPPEARLTAAAELLTRGWKVGLRIDPVVPVRHCRELYGRFLRGLDGRLPLCRLAILEMGGLRFPESSGDRHYYRVAELDVPEYRACLHDLRKVLPRSAVT